MDSRRSFLCGLKARSLPPTHPPPRLVPRLFFDCDQGQADPVVAIARDQSSVYLQLLMHETQPPSHFTVNTITRYPGRDEQESCLCSTGQC